MVNAFYAKLYHICCTDENLNHSMCPIGNDTWCKWQKDPTNYQHKHGLSEAIVELLEPIYEDLSDPNSLSKCLHSKTQNPNEFGWGNPDWLEKDNTRLVAHSLVCKQESFSL